MSFMSGLSDSTSQGRSARKPPRIEMAPPVALPPPNRPGRRRTARRFARCRSSLSSLWTRVEEVRPPQSRARTTDPIRLGRGESRGPTGIAARILAVAITGPVGSVELDLAYVAAPLRIVGCHEGRARVGGIHAHQKHRKNNREPDAVLEFRVRHYANPQASDLLGFCRRRLLLLLLSGGRRPSNLLGFRYCVNVLILPSSFRLGHRGVSRGRRGLAARRKLVWESTSLVSKRLT
eukprot:scaffold101596_cov63-Phaeocystis_antarctica.AAC.1